MTTTWVVEMSVTNNSIPEDYSHSDDHTRQTTDTPGFKPFTNNTETCNGAVTFHTHVKDGICLLLVKPNGLTSRRKFWTCVQLVFRLATYLF